MTKDIDYKNFQRNLNALIPDALVTEGEAIEAYRNLGEFACWLVQVNEREKLVPPDILASSDLPQQAR